VKAAVMILGTESEMPDPAGKSFRRSGPRRAECRGPLRDFDNSEDFGDFSGMEKNHTFEEMSQWFSYDSDSGSIKWKISPNKNHIKPGSKAGNMNSQGYLHVTFFGRRILVHRLAWLLFHGSWPEDQIDHINMVRDDNRIVNLREATNGENKWNTLAQSNSSHGSKGVAWDAQKQRWVARIMVHGRRIKIGRYRTREEAARAYAGAAEKLAGEFARW
jgi:hypothetical protein